MQRDIMTAVLNWKTSQERKPLVLKGVRQCGKTYILKEFGKKNYADVAYFNFEETPALATMFEQDFDVGRILFELGLFRGKPIRPEQTLLIFDEIQACARALTSLKYFCENGREYHLVCAGSLLGIALHEDLSFPVGKVDFLTLYPMSFYEFLRADGEAELADYLTSFQKKNQIPEAIAGKLRTLLRQYYVVGGMPEAVDVWCRTKDFTKAETVQKQILQSYELDFVKHAPTKDFPKLSAIWKSVPQQLAKPNSKFIFSQVKKGWRAKDLEDALQWLISAGLLYKVCRIEKPFLPLSAYADASAFKLYLSDVGLLRALAQVPAQVVLDASDHYVEFKGAMTENYVLNELVKASFDSPYYWSSGNSAEVDFVVQNGVDMIPIEVKSEQNTKARSLAEYRRKYAPDYAVVTSMKAASGGNPVGIPLFMLASMRRFVTQTDC